MPSDESFLAAIDADRSDDTCRLVYADWLEEQGDGRCIYLRSRCADEPCPKLPEETRIDWDWDLAVARKIGIRAHAERTKRLEFVKVVREALRISLGEAKAMLDRAEAGPTRVTAVSTLAEAFALQAALERTGAAVQLLPLWH
jgi:uncharacterized protein (TIGR02996 family)